MHFYTCGVLRSEDARVWMQTSRPDECLHPNVPWGPGNLSRQTTITA